jgi:hypothetical protein
MTREEKIEFANNIDFSGLFSHAEMLAGQKLTFGKPEVKESCGNVYFDFESNDILASCGVFGKALKSCVIGNFNNNVSKDKETNELFYWVSVDLWYQHLDGGRNGSNLFTAWYKKGEWTFRDASEQRN